MTQQGYIRPLTVKRLTVYPLSLRMKRKVSHAASERVVAQPIVVAVELENGMVGYGETLPRDYVTGETNETVLELLGPDGEFVKQLLAMRPAYFAQALEMIDSLPMLTEAGIPCPAARGAVELALLDAYLRSGDRSVSDLVGWMGLPGFGEPGSIDKIKYSMVLASRSVASLKTTARLACLFGIRHFKLKVGFPDDDQRLKAVWRIIGWRVLKGKATLRLDANSAWSRFEAIEKLTAWKNYQFAGVEQPLVKGSEEELISLREQTGVKIFHDESLVTMEDAERLDELGVADGFNIRVSKCGGLMPALRLANFARMRRIEIQLGCMVGETSILSAIGVHFLKNVPGVNYCEGCFGNLLLADDVTKRSLRFGWAGRPPKVEGDGWAVDVQKELLERYTLEKPIVVEL